MKVSELFEASVGKDLQLTTVSDQKAIDLLNEHCKQALWMLHDNRPIWRGVHHELKSDFQIVDPTKTERSSESTSNHYTVILDSNPLMADYPKRGRSLIGTMNQNVARGYGNLIAVVPFDNVSIGSVNKDDIWNTKVRFVGEIDEMSSFNDLFDDLGIDDSVEGFQKFAKRLKDDPNFHPEHWGGPTYFSKAERADFMGELYKAFSPAKLRFTLHTSANLQKVKGEVWVGGKAMLIKKDMWARLRSAYKELVKDSK